MTDAHTETPFAAIDTEFKSIYETLTTFSKQTRGLQDQLKVLQKTCKNF